MIESFASEETRKVFEQVGSRKLPQDMQATAVRKLNNLDAAMSLRELAAIPGHRLEKLTGDRYGQYSIRINDQWRICFEWSAANNAANVEIVDYHS